jgi:hypothetical protein
LRQGIWPARQVRAAQENDSCRLIKRMVVTVVFCVGKPLDRLETCCDPRCAHKELEHEPNRCCPGPDGPADCTSRDAARFRSADGAATQRGLGRGADGTAVVAAGHPWRVQPRAHGATAAIAQRIREIC